MTTMETHQISCICQFEYEISTEKESGHIEKEEWNCLNCGYQFTFSASMPVQRKDVRVLRKGIVKKSEDLNPRIIYDILKKKGAQALHHANTALTSLTFFENRALLSRQYIEDRSFRQTPQYTDRLDKIFGIYGDIFLDCVDIHKYASNHIKYGPVQFVFPLDILLNFPFIFVRISKLNPDRWSAKMSSGDKYYVSEAEFADQYHLGDFGTMLMFPHIGGCLPLDGNLEFIRVDKPDLSWIDSGKELHLEMLEHFNVARKAQQLNISWKLRNCNKKICNCESSYQDLDGPSIRKLFKI